MTFSTRRGRPKTARPEADLGTAELQRKRAHGLTQEPMDLCLERRILTPAQHWCGLHLRWLYTLRYGAPAVSSSLRALAGHASTRPDDPEWRAAREQEFAEAARLLRQAGCYQAVAALVIFNERPRFLDVAKQEAALENPRFMREIASEYEQLLAGFALLEDLWAQGIP